MATQADYRKISKSDATEARFPVEIATEYRVHISEAAYERMKKHAATTNEVELGGVLVGNICRDGNGCFLQIVGIIEGQNANNYGAQVTFTHQTWEHFNKVKDRDFPQQRIVGWYHTHPGFGVFLSGMDTFIQDNFFNHPYQVAIVIETKKQQEGCFAWVDGKVSALHRYWVGNREIQLATGDAEPFSQKSMPFGAQPSATAPVPVDYGPPERLPSYMSLLTAMLLFVCGILLGKVWFAAEFRDAAMASLQSELYSIVEFATLNVTASKDLSEANDKLTAIREKLEKGGSVGSEIKDLSEHLTLASQSYEKKRSNFRADMARLMATKQTLAERVDTAARRQDELSAFVAQIYVMRAMDALGRNGPMDPLQASPAERQAARKLMDAALRMAPELKIQLEQVYPKLLPALYTDEADARKDAAPAASGGK